MSRPLTPQMRQALRAMLKGPLRRGRHAFLGDGWIGQDESYHALVVVKGLHQRGLTLPPAKLVALSIAGRKAAQRISSEQTTRPSAA